mgnify:CR=1 FL=1
MLPKLPRRAALALAIGIFAALPLRADTKIGDLERVQIEQIVRDYLLQNPELLVEVMRRLEARQDAQAKVENEGKIKRHRTALFATPHDFVVNPGGEIPVVEFFDYQCGYCKRFLPSVTRLLKEDKTVRFVFKEFPILGEMSMVASKAAMAAKMQGKYMEFHNAVMALRRPLSEQLIFQVAAHVGLDVDRLRKDMEKPAVAKAIDENRRLAANMGIRSTPSLIVGDQLVPGAIDYGQLTELIQAAKDNCAVC